MRVQVVVVHSHKVVTERLAALLAAEPTIAVIGAVVNARAGLAVLQRSVLQGERPVLVIEPQLLTAPGLGLGPQQRGGLAVMAVGSEGGAARLH